MIRSLLLLISFIVVATSAPGQTVNVRSGEHSGFTRLVLRIPADTSFDLNQSTSKVLLNTSLANVRYDVSQVFSRIPRTRLASISQEQRGGPLELVLACGCEVRAVREGSDLLVLDIVDANNEGQTPEAAVSSVDKKKAGESGSDIEPGPLPIVRFPVVTKRTATGGGAPNFDLDTAVNLPKRAAVELLESRLLDQIGRAAEQGLLSVVSSMPDRNHEGREEKENQNVQVERLSETLLPPIEITTSIDRDLADVAKAIHTAATATLCVPSEDLALHEWSDELPFETQVGRLRAEIVGEFDKFDQESVIALAKTYIHFGFGAEARQALNLLSGTLPNIQQLKALADAIDDAEVSGENPFVGQQHCPTDVAMWSVLTSEIDGATMNSDAIMQGLARLPDHLRAHLGPILSRKFADFGDKQSAESVLRVTNRVLAESTPTSRLAEASVNLLEGDTEAAVDRLEEVAESPSEYSPQAVILMIENKFQMRSSVQPDLPNLISGYAIEYRGADIEKDLNRAYLVSLALSDQFATSFRELESLKDKNPDQFIQSATPLLHLLEERADDVTFLRLVLHHSQGIEQDLPAGLTEKIATRLLELGFAEQAQRFLFQIDISKASNVRRILKARAALSMELPHQAMVALLGMEGAEVDALRARAMLQKRDFHMVAQFLDSQENSEDAFRSLWHSDQTGKIDETAGNRYSRVSDITNALRQGYDSQSDLSPLANARALIKNSVESRTDISGLLSDFLISGN